MLIDISGIGRPLRDFKLARFKHRVSEYFISLLALFLRVTLDVLTLLTLLVSILFNFR